MKNVLRLSIIGSLMCLFASCGGPSPGDSITVGGAEMIYIPGGETVIGPVSNDSASVRLSPYLIDKYEVTNRQYREFATRFNIPFPVPRAYNDYPVVGISWREAEAYAAFRGCRLPTEAEWEYAARGTDGRDYPWGDDWHPGYANGNDQPPNQMHGQRDGSQDGYPNLAPVGTYPQGVSPFGVHDMAGNAWEWVSDWFSAYPDEPVVDYQGPQNGTYRVIRGGSCGVNRLNLRTFHRSYRLPSRRTMDLGFRCASDYPPVPAGQLAPGVEQSIRATRQAAEDSSGQTNQ